MAKIEITYTFDSYGEDQDEMEILTRHKAYYCALCDLESFIRDLRKYSEKESITVDELSDKFNEVVNSRNINLSL